VSITGNYKHNIIFDIRDQNAIVSVGPHRAYFHRWKFAPQVEEGVHFTRISLVEIAERYVQMFSVVVT